MQNSAKQVEGMVRMKMEQREYIILCLEDTNDWSNATTRRLVMQVRVHVNTALHTGLLHGNVFSQDWLLDICSMTLCFCKESKAEIQNSSHSVRHSTSKLL